MSRNQPTDPHIFEFEFPGGRIFEVEAAPDQQDKALATAKDFWNREQSQRTGALQQSSKSEYRPGGFTGADFQNPVQRALNPIIDAVQPFTLPQLPKTFADIMNYVGDIGSRAESGIAQGTQQILGGDIAGGISTGMQGAVSPAQIPIDMAKGIGSELGSAYESAQQGDLAGAGVRAGMTIAPFIKPLASGIRAGIGAGASGAAGVGTGVARGGRQVGSFAEAPLIETPEISFQRATRNLIDPEDIPHTLDTLSEHAQRTGVTPRTAFQAEQAFNADTKLLSDYYQGFVNPQRNLVIPNSRMNLYQAQVDAIPAHIRQNNTAAYNRAMRKLQSELSKPDLTVGEMDDLRSSLASAGRKRGVVDTANADNVISTALQDAQANVVRDNFYDFLDQNGLGHGSLAREINFRIDKNMRAQDAFRQLGPDSTLEAGRSKVGMLAEIPSKIASLSGFGPGGGKSLINEGIFDAVQRWVPQRGALPNNPFRPFNPQVPYGPYLPSGPPNPLVGSFGAGGRAGTTGSSYQPFPNQPGQAPPPLVNPPGVSGSTIARVPGVTLPPRPGAPPLVESYMNPTGRAGSPFIGDIDPITGLRIVPPPLANPTIIPKPRPPK